jgi:hypothetical protein
VKRQQLKIRLGQMIAGYRRMDGGQKQPAKK